jgi:hypothetical protein
MNCKGMVSGIYLGPWRLIFILNLNLPSAIKICVSLPLVTAKLLGDYYDNSQYGANRTFKLYSANLFAHRIIGA